MIITYNDASISHLMQAATGLQVKQQQVSVNDPEAEPKPNLSRNTEA